MLLFEAPLDFDPALKAEYRAWMPETHDPGQVTVWVCDPLGGEIAELHLLQFPNLLVLATPSTGTDHIDAFACKRLGVKVLSLLDDREGLETISASAEFTFKLLLDALRLLPGRELQGKKVGIVGRGRIGRRLLHWLSAFEASGFFYDPAWLAWSKPLDWLFANCDAMVICCTLNDSTRGLITGDLLRSMKRGAVLVNTARAKVVVETALLSVTNERPDIRVAVDVTDYPEQLAARGAIVTPHIAGNTFESRTKAARIILNLLKGATL